MITKPIKQDLFMLPAAAQIQQIAEAYGVTAEVMPVDDLYAMWDAWQAAYEADADASPMQLRSYLLP